MVLSEGERGRKYRTPGEFFYIQIFFFTFFLFLKGVSFFFSRGGMENFLFLKKEGGALGTLKYHTTVDVEMCKCGDVDIWRCGCGDV